jgi:integrase
MPEKRKINFTKKEIDALQPPSKGHVYYRDSKVRGLSIGVGVTGNKSFIFYRKIKGNPERISLGKYPDLTIEQARGRASDINSDIANGLNPADIKRGRKAELTFSQLFEDYLERHSKINKMTWKEDKSKYETYLAKPLGKKKLSEVDRARIATIHSDITRVGYAITANRVKALVSSIFGWAISSGLCQSNPAIGIKSNREQSRDRFLQSDELPRFFKALEEERNETVRDYCFVSLYTGVRRGKVLSMQWSDISFERNEWHLDTDKNYNPVTVTLAPEVITILQSRKPKTPAKFVFPGEGKAGHLINPDKGWKRICERAGIDPRDLWKHDLRRTLGSWQANQGTSLHIIGKSLNHKSVSTTAIYARLNSGPVRKSVEAATAAILEAAQANPKVVPIKGSSK